MDFKAGSAIFFDFDGVLINSTDIKTEAYRELFKAYGTEVVEKIIDYHQQHGGISRVEKIVHARKNFIDAPSDQEEIAKDVAMYSDLVMKKVITARWVPGAEDFVKRHYKKLPLFVISGTPEDELLEITKKRGMERYFVEILGSPTRKPKHVRTLVEKYRLNSARCFFIGDALTDYHTAKETGVPFIGIKTEVDFPEHCVVLTDCIRLEECMTTYAEKISG